MSLNTRWQFAAVAAVLLATAAAYVTANKAGAGSDVTVAPTIVAMAAKPEEGTDARVRLTATVSFAGGGQVPVGTVEFTDETLHKVLGVTNVSMPWIVVDHLAQGPHVLRARYSGVTSYFPFVIDPSTSVPLSYAEQVRPEVTLSSSQNPSLPGQVVTLTAMVVSPAGTPAGAVTFQDRDTVLASHVPLNSSGVASFTTSALDEGLRRIVATYEGDAGNSAATSARLAQNVSEGDGNQRDVRHARLRPSASP
jgi:hypothetical protein